MSRFISTVAGKVVVRREPPMTVTEGGLALPAQSQEKNKLATVVALPRLYDGPLRVGDQVLLEWFAGTQVELGSLMFVCREEDVLALDVAHEL